MCKKLVYLFSFVLVTSLILTSVAEGADPSLVAWYRFDGDALDSSGNDLHGTEMGDPTYEAGVFGQAISLDGDGDYVDCGIAPEFDITDYITFTYWIKVVAFDKGWNTVLSRGDGSWRSSRAGTNNFMEAAVSGTTGDWTYGITPVDDEQWHHIGWVYDGTMNYLYVDGEVDATEESTGQINVTTYPLWIGDNSQATGRFWTGLIDDVLIFNRALTQEEVQRIMQSSAGESPQASGPNPADGTIHEDTWVYLSWRAGDFAVSHDVYLGDNFDDVNDGAAETFQGNQAETYLVAGFPGFAYPDGLIRGTTYYWRIDEVNDTEPNSPWKGDVWSFKIANYLVVDDFEDYNDYPPDEIFSTWIDGYEVATNGALVGNDTFPFAEQSIVHSGAQSMPYFYDNSGTANYSEAERTFSPAQDWTRESVKVLSLWFKGYPAYMGSFVEGPTGTFTMTAEGVDIWDNSDQFHFAYKELSGAGTIIAKVESVENTHEWAKAGVMIRDTLDADSRHAMMVVTPAQGVSFQRRTPAGASSSSDNEAGITAPQWVKIERTVSGFVKAYYSADGTTWTQLGTLQTVTMNTPMYIGLALTSHNSGVVCEAKFSNVSFPGTTVGQQWTNQDIGITSNDAEPMYVVLNGSAVVTHDNPDAAQIGEWTEWTIDLQAFADQGVNLPNVNTIALGLGDKTNPQAGGSGTMYFDDIRLYRLAEQAP
ncbi:MAG: LamG domain-containing protein [Planctomycetota bacterium]